MINMDDLVSVCLLTYNHESSIEDALEALIAQSYKNIELIIMDDCSTDQTTVLIEQFMDRLKDRFTKVVFIKNEKNTGNISRNCNQLIKMAEGTWVRTIAGDDALLSNCITDLVNASINHPDAAVIHADAFVEGENYRYNGFFSGYRLQERVEGYEGESLTENLFYSDCICAPTTLFRRNTFEKFGYYDEEIGWEDYEYWLRLSTGGAKFFYLDKPVVVWKQGDSSVSNRNTKDGERKLIKWIKCETAAKEKYICKLPYEQQKKYMGFTYRYFYEECSRLSSTKALDVLNDLYSKYVPVKDELNTEKKDISNAELKAIREAEIFSSWIDGDNNLKNVFKKWHDEKLRIAIFGYARIGKRLHKELNRSGVDVQYVIDNKGAQVYSTIPIHTYEDLLPEVDIIINTAIGAYEGVLAELGKRSSAEVIDFQTMVFKSLL